MFLTCFAADPAHAPSTPSMARSWRRRERRRFTGDYGVPDTVDGRFDMIVLHLVLVLRRMRTRRTRDPAAVGQQFFDRFCHDHGRQSARNGGRRPHGAEGDAAVSARPSTAALSLRAALDRDARTRACSTALARNVFGHGRAAGARRGLRPICARPLRSTQMTATLIGRTTVIPAQSGRIQRHESWRRGDPNDKQRTARRPWSVPVAVDDVAEAGRHFDLDGRCGDRRAQRAGLA